VRSTIQYQRAHLNNSACYLFDPARSTMGDRKALAAVKSLIAWNKQ